MRHISKTAAALAAAVTLGCAAAYPQAKKPTIIVIPSDAWCAENGYTETYELQGKTTTVADYEKAIQQSVDLNNVITKIGEIMAEREFPIKDLATAVRNINQSTVEDEMTLSSTSGASLAETPLDRLLNRAKADITVEITWSVNTLGPKRSVTYTMKGVDSYTSKIIAATQGTGPESFSAEMPVLLEEAVVEKMDAFLAELQAHFEDLVENGREIVMNVRVFDNGSGISLEDEYGGYELVDIIDDWMADNTVKHRYSLANATETRLSFEQVRIPLYRDNGMAMDTRHFATQLRRFLRDRYGITSKLLTKGLGRADLIIGEK